MTDSLERLLAAARALPGDKDPLPPTALRAPPASTTGIGDAAALRRRLGAVLQELARRLEPALPAALGRANRQWDQVDAITLVDEPLRHEAAALRRDAAGLAAAAAGSPEERAAGAEVSLAVEAALGLVFLVERRMATLVRLRLRGPDPDLLPGGRPFIDVAAALAEAARRWS